MESSNLIEHHRNGPPVGVGALKTNRSGATPISDSEAAKVTGGFWLPYCSWAQPVACSER